MDSASEQKFCLVLLNQPFERETLLDLLSKSGLVVCADGGANRLHDTLLEPEREIYLPAMIVGDFDSLRPEVRAFYESKGVTLRSEPNQDLNDLEKTLQIVLEKEGPQ